MALQLVVNGLSSGKAEGSSMISLAASREKMISLLVEARLLQTPEGSSLLIPHLAKDKMHEASNVSDLSEIFGASGKLSQTVRHIIGSYLSDEEIALLGLYLNMPKFINLKDRGTLQPYLAQSSREKEEHLTACVKIVQGVYEVPARRFPCARSGTTYPMNPEVQAYMMQLVEGEIVLEMAGGYGELSALLAFSGAARVCFNEIEKEQVKVFEDLKRTLPEDVAKKLESIEGDCFDILKRKPELEKRVGLVLCRNLIHFFTDKKQAEFFALLKKILRPGGIAVLLTNSVYTLLEQRQLAEQHPDATCSSLTRGVIIDESKPTEETSFFRAFSICEESAITTDPQTRYLYTRKPGAKWEIDNAEFSKLDRSIKPHIQEAFAPYKSTMNKIKAGTVKVVTSAARVYSVKTLPALCTRHGFEPVHTFVASYNGHLSHMDDLFRARSQAEERNPPHSLGVIVRCAVK